MERTLGCNVAMAARENKQQEMLQEVTKHLYLYLYFICVCICKKEELLLEFIAMTARENKQWEMLLEVTRHLYLY